MAGGVIEHLEGVQPVVDNLYRVLRKDGVSFNTLPCFNLGNFLYRFKWGGIPNVPVLKQLSEFFHITLLKGKHMVFGYELQYTKNAIKKVHLKAGFKEDYLYINKYDCHIALKRINKYYKTVCLWLVDHSSQFWPMIKVIAIK